MKTFKQEFGAIVFALLQVLLGILLLVDPIGFTSGIIVAFGTVLLIMGTVCIVKYFRTDAAEAAKSQTMLKGLIALLAGWFCAFKSYWFVATFPVLSILYGVAVLVTGLGKVQWMFDMLRAKKKKWFLAAISAVLSIVCAVVILSNPFATTAVLWTFTGISLIVDAVFDIVAIFISGNDRDGKEETAA